MFKVITVILSSTMVSVIIMSKSRCQNLKKSGKNNLKSTSIIINSKRHRNTVYRQSGGIRLCSAYVAESASDDSVQKCKDDY